MEDRIKQCYCEQVLVSDLKNGHNKITCIDVVNHDWTRAALYMDYNTNSKKFALFAEANGEGNVGIYVGISYCPFCGKNLRRGRNHESTENT